MDIALHEIPLMLFTTLAPMGAGAFVVLFIAFMQENRGEAQLKKLDRLTIIPVLFALVGLGASFIHLANPVNAINVMNTFGSTPLANEILAFSIFFALAVIYWIVAMVGGLKSSGVRKGFSAVVALAGLVSAVFMGLAYLIPAIPPWNSPLSIVSVLGVWLFGGATLGMFLCALTNDDPLRVSGSEVAEKSVMAVGAVVLLVGTVLLYITGSAASSPIIDVAANAASLTAVFGLGLVCIIAGALCAFFAKGTRRVSLLGIAVVLAILGSFLARMVFYGMQIGLGL